MTLVRFDPFRDLMNLQNRISQALSEVPSRWNTEDSYGSWVPPVDIFERADELVIRAELAGVEQKDIDVRVEENTLVLSGERKQDPETEQGKAYRMERAFGAFNRRFGLPTTVDPKGIRARYYDGVLEVTLPKAETAKPRKIEIEQV